MANTPLSDDDDLYRLPTDKVLNRLQRTTVLYYLHETNPDNGLVRDKTDPDAPCSIAAVGMALATIPVVVERGVHHPGVRGQDRPPAAPVPARMPPGAGAGRRRVQGLLLPLPRHGDRPPRLAVRAVHDRLGVPVRRHAHRRRLLRPRHGRRGRDPPPGRRALPPGRLELGRDGGPTLTHGWRPETGFLPHRWEGYDEGLLLYVLGLGSPTHPLPPESYAAYCATYQWKTHLRPRAALLRAAVHPPALAPVDRLPRHPRRLHARRTAATTSRTAGRRPTCSRSTRSATRCSSPATASTAGGSRPATAPAGCKRMVDGVERQFFDYIARGAPFGPDDGTVAPWVVVASLPFAPEIVIPTVRHFARLDLGMTASRTGSSRRSTRRSAWRTARPAGG